MTKTKNTTRLLTWEKVSMAARSPETRSRLRSEFDTRGNLLDACTAVEDWLEFQRGKVATEERTRIRDVRRGGE